MTDEKPGHILEIPASLGRDIDKGQTPPLEAFMSDTTLQQAWDATQARDTAIHAESLVPISRADAAERVAFDGQSMPKLPQRRRVIPRPYQRDRISAGRHGKTWQHIWPSQVELGDMTTEVGLVVTIEHGKVLHQTRAELELPGDPEELVATSTVTELTGIGGVVKQFTGDSQIQVFRRSE